MLNGTSMTWVMIVVVGDCATLQAREMTSVASSDLLRQEQVDRAEGVSIEDIARMNGGRGRTPAAPTRLQRIDGQHAKKRG